MSHMLSHIQQWKSGSGNNGVLAGVLTASGAACASLADARYRAATDGLSSTWFEAELL